MLTIDDYQRIFHEIKNSVSVIGCSMQLIEKEHPEVKGFSFWEDTLTDITNLRTLIMDVSSAGLCEHPVPTDVNLYDFLDRLRTAACSLFDDDAMIIFDIPSGLPMGHFDSLRIHHALLNLIKNASEAMNRKGTLTIRTHCQNDAVFFEVCDNGGGILPEIQEQIFTPFYSSKKEGSGLGLSIAKEIIENHNGSLTFTSIPKEGTTFTVQLPLAATQNGKSDPMSEAS